MSDCIIDASALLSNLVPSQSSRAADRFFEDVTDAWLAPELMRLEVRNAVLRLERRGLLAAGSTNADFALLESRIAFAPSPSPAALVRVDALARRLSLGVYDAVYLELAERMGAAIASRDAALIEAASRSELAVRDLR